MHRNFNHRAAGGNDPIAHPFGQFNMVAIAGAKVAAGLGNANDRLARLQLVACQTVVEIAFEIERCHLLIVGIVEPLLGSQFRFDI